MMVSKPQYVPATDFFNCLGIHFDLGSRLVALAVLIPDATLNQRPIFLADLQTYEQAKAAVALYRVRQRQKIQEIEESYA